MTTWSPDYPGPKVIGDCQTDPDLAHPRAAEAAFNNIQTLLNANVWNYIRAHETFFRNLNDRVTTLEGGGGGGGGIALKSFSAYRSTDQISGSVLICDTTTSGTYGQSYAGYNTSTGICTIQAGDGGMWAFFAEIPYLATADLAASVTRNFEIINATDTLSQSRKQTFTANQQHTVAAFSGIVRIAAGDTIKVSLSNPLSDINSVYCEGRIRARFSGVRLAV